MTKGLDLIRGGCIADVQRRQQDLLTFKGGIRYTKSKRDANSCFFGVAAEGANQPFAPLYTFFANLLRSQNGLSPITVTPGLPTPAPRFPR